jgi:hypothetical protein
MTFLLPAEHLDGTEAEQRQLRTLLTRLRASAQPAALPHLTFQALPGVLASSLADRSLFDAGYELLSRRYADLGMRGLLPLSRVWVGVSSSAPPGGPASFGGFHHPGQGYRHLQMTATITAYGQLTAGSSASPQAVALDLLRSYAHDCLHYRYRVTPDGQVARVQYGINFRGLDGSTYSAPDPPDAIAPGCMRADGLAGPGPRAERAPSGVPAILRNLVRWPRSPSPDGAAGFPAIVLRRGGAGDPHRGAGARRTRWHKEAGVRPQRDRAQQPRGRRPARRGDDRSWVRSTPVRSFKENFYNERTVVTSVRKARCQRPMDAVVRITT